VEVATGVLKADAYLMAVERLVGFLAAEGVAAVEVCYGFGCDCPDGELYQPVVMPPAALLDFIARGVAADYYRVGRDNLHVADTAGRLALLLCHESDIHAITEDAGLCGRLVAFWQASGVPGIMERQGSVWVPFAAPQRSADTEPNAATVEA
jgi:hypothetical protein